MAGNYQKLAAQGAVAAAPVPAALMWGQRERERLMESLSLHFVCVNFLQVSWLDVTLSMAENLES